MWLLVGTRCPKAVGHQGDAPRAERGCWEADVILVRSLKELGGDLGLCLGSLSCSEGGSVVLRGRLGPFEVPRVCHQCPNSAQTPLLWNGYQGLRLVYRDLPRQSLTVILGRILFVFLFFNKG